MVKYWRVSSNYGYWKSFWLSWPWFSWFRLENIWIWQKFYHMDRKFIKISTVICYKRWTTTQYFKLERGARQVDQISAYFFILTLGILFLLIKKHPEIKVIDKFKYCFLYKIIQRYFWKIIINCIPNWTIQYFFRFFKIKGKSNKMRKSGNRSHERSSIGSLWYETHWTMLWSY